MNLLSIKDDADEGPKAQERRNGFGCADQYGAIADFYDALYGGGLPGDLLEIGQVFRLATPGEIVDVGCGSGRVSCYLAEQGHVVSGVDASPRMIQLAHLQRALLDPTVASRLQFRECHFPDRETTAASRFDGVVASFNVLNEVEDETQLRLWLEGAVSCLRTGGRLVAHMVDLGQPSEQTNEVVPLRQRLDAVTATRPHLRSFEQDVVNLRTGHMMRVIRIVRQEAVAKTVVLEHRISRRYWPRQLVLGFLQDVGFRLVTTTLHRSTAGADGWSISAGQWGWVYIVAEKNG